MSFELFLIIQYILEQIFGILNAPFYSGIFGCNAAQNRFGVIKRIAWVVRQQIDGILAVFPVFGFADQSEPDIYGAVAQIMVRLTLYILLPFFRIVLEIHHRNGNHQAKHSSHIQINAGSLGSSHQGKYT